MTDEQRNALARLRKREYPATYGSLHIADLKCIAELAMAEHPADDDEPITAEWLKSVGFKSDDDPNEFMLMHDDPSLHGNISTGSWQHFDGLDNNSYMPTPRTRGQLRRLCSALGITLSTGG